MRRISSFLIVMLLLFFAASAQAEPDFCKWAFIRLDYVRQEKKDQLMEFCNRVHEQANSIEDDRMRVDFFHLKNKYYELAKASPPPDDLQHSIEKFKKKFRKHYIRHYLGFYDIQFISKSGDIFHTIRKEANYHKNIFMGELAKTHLSQHLQKKPEKDFVDFQYFFPSDEPAAFFIQPAYKDKEHL